MRKLGMVREESLAMGHLDEIAKVMQNKAPNIEARSQRLQKGLFQWLKRNINLQRKDNDRSMRWTPTELQTPIQAQMSDCHITDLYWLVHQNGVEPPTQAQESRQI